MRKGIICLLLGLISIAFLSCGGSGGSSTSGGSPDTTPPSVPTGLTATAASSNSISLNWTASTDDVGVTGYKIFRNGTQISTSTTNAYNDSGLASKTTYTYSVSAYDAEVNNSSQSSSASATTLETGINDTTPPTAPSNVVATPVSASQIDISWTASTDNNGVAGYEVYRDSALISTVTGTAYSDAGLSANTTYTYTVTAFDGANNKSAASQPASATTQTSGPTGVPPTVTSTSPTSAATGVLLNSAVTVTFSTVMDASTINATTFTLRNGSNTLRGAVSCSGKTAVFTVNGSLSNNTTYTVTLTTGIKDMSGVGLASDYTMSFTTTGPDWSPPTILSMLPSDQSNSISINAQISATFSEPIIFSTVTSSSFTVIDHNNNPVLGSLSYLGTTVTFSPTAPLSYNTVYTVTFVSSGVSDATGMPMFSDAMWLFMTQNPYGIGSWQAVAATNAPSAREGHTAVWTGQEMIIWGGYDGGYLNTGARYNPTTDTWTTMTTNGAPSGRTDHKAFWTGSEMIVWGGYNPQEGNIHKGHRYNPETDTWSVMATGSSPGSEEAFAWTGTELIVWPVGSSYVNKYKPVTNTWSGSNATGTWPSLRSGYATVWTGSEMIVWGGGLTLTYPCCSSNTYNDGGKYNPITNSWSQTTTVGAPSGSGVAIWTGEEMIMMGAARYNPNTDSWRPMSMVNAPPIGDSFIWTNSEIIVWGSWRTGGFYNPQTDTWKPLSSANAPTLSNHTSVWTGTEMIIWGGYSGNSRVNIGARFKP